MWFESGFRLLAKERQYIPGSELGSTDDLFELSWHVTLQLMLALYERLSLVRRFLP